MPRCPRRTVSFCAVIGALLWLGVSVPAFGQQEGGSASFLLTQSTANNGGETSTSGSYVLDGSVAQSATVGETASTTYLVESGFWNSLATFEILRIDGVGSGFGDVAGPEIACDVAAGTEAGACSDRVSDGTVVALVASPDASNSFDGWTGCDGLATTTLAGDTCQVDLTASRTVVVAFTALGDASGIVFRDVDGDGVQDPSEPGLGGVRVTLTGTGGTVETTTAADGSYSFVDIDPGTYTLAVDAATLPVGLFATGDPDGVGTPGSTTVVVDDGGMPSGLSFAFQPRIDLVLDKVVDQDRVPATGRLVYTLTVQNLGPALATHVVVTDLLPERVTAVATNGCDEDPLGYPFCTLGDLAPGELASYTLEVSAPAGPSGGVVNSASVLALEVDTNPDNDVAEAVSLEGSVLEIPIAGREGLIALALLLGGLGVLVLGKGRIG